MASIIPIRAVREATPSDLLLLFDVCRASVQLNDGIASRQSDNIDGPMVEYIEAEFERLHSIMQQLADEAERRLVTGSPDRRLAQILGIRHIDCEDVVDL